MNEIVLQIGKYQVCRYEFEKQKEKFLRSVPQQNKASIDKWLNGYTDNCFIIADAYSKKYDTSRIVKLRDYYIELNMTSSVGGYYWNKIIEPSLKFTEKDIKTFYKQSSKNKKYGSYKKEREKIIKELRDIRTKIIVEKYQKEIFESTKIKMNDKLIDELFIYLSKTSYSSFSESDFPLNQEIIARFIINNKEQHLTAIEFIDYYFFTPFAHTTIKQKENIQSTIQSLVLQKYMHEKAINDGVLKEEKFTLEKKAILSTYLIDEYFKKEIVNNITIAESEEKVLYENTRLSFKQPEKCTVCLFKFKDRKSLQNNWHLLFEQTKQSNFKGFRSNYDIPGLIFQKDSVVLKKNETTYPIALVNSVFSSRLNQISPPNIDFNGEFYIFYKIKEEGERIQTFEEVKDIIYDQLRMNKIKQAAYIKLLELKKKYAINFDKTKEIINS